MKRLISAALALALLSGTAAYADPFGPRGGHYDRYDRGWDHHRRHGDDTGTAFAVGFGLLALTAILASANRDRERARAEAYGPPPPPPPPPGYRDYGPDNRPQNYPDNGQDNQNNGPDNQGPYDNDRPYRPDRQ